jgi:hypothetical protein
MAGLHVRSGAYSGGDKSGTPLFGLLGDLGGVPEELIIYMKSGFDTIEQKPILIGEDNVKSLLPALIEYRNQIILKIGHEDVDKAMREDEVAGVDMFKAKYGRGPGYGWRLYCVTDLVEACTNSLSEHCELIIEPA